MKNENYQKYPWDHVETVHSFNDIIYNSSAKFGDKTAFTFERGGEDMHINFARFKSDVLSLGNYFKKNGHTRRKIALIGENSYEWLAAYFAVICSGNIIVPIDRELPVADIFEQLQDCGCSFMIHSDMCGNITEQLAKLADGKLDTLNIEKFSEITAEGDTSDLFCENPEELAAIIYTSGTTGKSKGVMLSQKNICASITASCMMITTYHGVSLAFLPFHHIFAIVSCVLRTVTNGTEVILCKGIGTVTSDMIKYKPTFFCAVPALVEAMYNKIWANIRQGGKEEIFTKLIADSNALREQGIDRRKEFFSPVLAAFGGNLDFIISGGAYIDAKYVKGFDDLGITVIVGYGITEGASALSCNRPYYNRLNTIGIPLYGIDIRIDNPDENGTGEICATGDAIMLGYYNDKAATDAVMTEDGWFRTGDLGRMDEDSFVYFMGRLKNLIILSNGKNVSPEELEAKLTQIPGVNEVVVSAKGNSIYAEIYPDAEFLEHKKIDNPLKYFKGEVEAINKTQPAYKFISDVKLRDTEFEKTTSRKIKRTESMAKDENEVAVYVPPVTEEEKEICRIYAEALNVTQYGMADNFIDMEGDSLTATLIATDLADIAEKHGVEITPTDIYTYPTVESLIKFMNGDL